MSFGSCTDIRLQTGRCCMSIADELQKLQQLHSSGALSAEEYTKAKQAVLRAASREPTSPPRCATEAQLIDPIVAKLEAVLLPELERRCGRLAEDLRYTQPKVFPSVPRR